MVFPMVTDAAVNYQSHDRKPESDPRDFHTAQRSQQNLCHCKEKVGKTDDRKIGKTGFYNCLMCCEKPQQPTRKKACQDKQDESNKNACAHGPGTDLSHRFCLFLSPVLASEYDKSVSQRHEQLLKDELYLIYSGYSG